MKNLSTILLCLVIVSAFSLISQAQDYRSVEEAEGLPVGSQAPLFTAQDQHDSTFQLQEALNQGPVVMIFYRGQWCPVCNKHLSHLQDSLELIHGKGGKVIAISPEKPELLDKTAQKTNAAFTLLHDKDYAIAKAYDVIYQPDKKKRIMYNTMLGANLDEAHSDDSERLPIPATYIINPDRTIIWRQFDPNYKNRSSVAEILRQLASEQDKHQ
jgi:peroxiredoxin